MDNSDKDNIMTMNTSNCEKDVRYITYEEYGAVGDGVTNDFEAILKAHEAANASGLPVKASGRYYISDTGNRIVPIRTDVDWTGAEIIIDDSVIEASDPQRKIYVFDIESQYAKKVHDAESELVKKINAAGGINKNEVNSTRNFFDYKPGYPVMLLPFNNSHKEYIRIGVSADQGGLPQRELIVLDGEGRLDLSTAIMFDFNGVSYIDEYRIDDEPITILGGTITTVANQAPCKYTYYSRGIVINRSNVTVKGLTHKIVGEGDSGSPYDGFLSIHGANNILIESCTFQAHRMYVDTVSKVSPMGTYELGSLYANGIRYRGCVQSNFCDPEGKPTYIWYDEEGNTGYQNVKTDRLSTIWGVHGSNYSKNVIFDGCTLNRIDAHCGAYNMSVIDSKIKTINLVGGGTALIENSTVYSAQIADLRADYGSTWNGDVVIKNVVFVPSTNEKARALITGVWTNHYFGYPVSLPCVYIDGLKIEDPSTEKVYVFGFSDLGDTDPTAPTVTVNGECVENKNPMHIGGKIVIRGCDGLAVSAAPSDSALLKYIKLA